MRRLALIALIAVQPLAASARATLSDEEIKQQIIRNSIASYPGRCPCPYNTMRNGNSCGGRSAYSKPGRRSPICYQTDVTPQMMQRYKNRNSN